MKKNYPVIFAFCSIIAWSPPLMAAAVPGGTLDPTTIPKYVTPLVIPPVMKLNTDPLVPTDYQIAVRQFQQQILPTGFPATTVWSYGPAADPLPNVAPDLTGASQFNYPAYTVETTTGTPVSVRWVNGLVDANGAALPHLLGDVVDQTLHWANPGKAMCMSMDPNAPPSTGPDCMTMDPTPYTGPVPIVPHLHGAHVDPHSDGYPQAWWLPAGVDPTLYNVTGSLFSDSTGATPGSTTGYADYSYRNDQPATTLWFHDHTLGMTRVNVYAGPAGFWLIRGGAFDGAINGVSKAPAMLPGPAPVAGQGVAALNTPGDPVRNSIREIPIVIQDRSFNADGSLFYPSNRAFFEGLNATGNLPFPGAGQLLIPFVPEPTLTGLTSDISPIWNPEVFFNVMVVNGVSWPTIEVAPALYRFRILNGSNSRFLNLELNKMKMKAFKPLKADGPIPFFQIGGDQGFLPQVVRIQKGEASPLAGNGKIPILGRTDKSQALLLGLAERADVIVDFRGLANGTVIQMFNTAPDAPFGGFPDIPADPATTGQVMQFVVNSTLNGASPTDPLGATPATDPYSLVLNAEPANAITPVATRSLSLNEEASATVCVNVTATGDVVEVAAVPPLCLDANNVAIGVPMAPKDALLGTFDSTTGIATPLRWSSPITERPIAGDTEQWEIFNQTMDGHPIHLHLVRFQVQNRQALDMMTNLPTGALLPPQANEMGYKDTVIAYPGQVTRVKATFEIPGLYVWHCHILEHEDNEMMRPYCVDGVGGVNSCPSVP